MTPGLFLRPVSDGFAWLSFPQHIREKSSPNGDTGLHPPGDDDSRALAGHAEAAAPHPQAASPIVDLERALIHGAKRGNDLPGDGDIFRLIAGGIVIDRGYLGRRTASRQ